MNQRTKSTTDTSQKPYAFVMWETGALLSRYQADNVSWKLDEFNERVNNLQRLTTLGLLIYDTKFSQKTLVTNLLKRIHSILSGLKEYKEKDRVRILWGYLLLPLKRKIQAEVAKMDKNTRERSETNLQHAFLFLMHYYSGTKFTMPTEKETKDSDKWTLKINEAIFNPKDQVNLDTRSKIKDIVGSKDDEYDNFMINVDHDVEQNAHRMKHSSEKTNADMEEDTEEKDLTKLHYKQLSIFKNFIFYVNQMFEFNDERVRVSKLILHKVISFIINRREEQEVSLFDDLKESVKGTTFMQDLSTLAGDEGYINLKLLNRNYVLTKMLDIKRCSVCNVFVPSLIVDHTCAEPLINNFQSEKKGSALYYFMRLILTLKHDQHYISKIWRNYKMLTEDELKKKELDVKELESKKVLRSMQDLIAKTRMEIKIDVKATDVIGGGEDSDTFLEKLHITLRNQIRDQIYVRTRYAATMKHLCDYIRYYLNFRIKNAIREMGVAMTKSTKIIGGKKERCLFESLLFNFKLGFANWAEVDAFEKENKFVKRLRQSIFKEGVSQLIFQDLTKNEKALISTKMFIGASGIQDIISTKKYNEAT